MKCFRASIRAGSANAGLRRALCTAFYTLFLDMRRRSAMEGLQIPALVAPVAFGFCSIVAMAVIVLTSDHLNLGLFTKVPSGSLEAVALFMIYFIPGLIGSWGAVAAVTKIVSRCNIDANRRYHSLTPKG